MPKERKNMHTVATATNRLQAAGFEVAGVREIEHGHQLGLGNGHVVNVYRTGTTLPQGPERRINDAVREALRIVPDESIIPASELPPDPHADGFRTTPASVARILAGFPKDGHVPYVNPAWDPNGTGVPF